MKINPSLILEAVYPVGSIYMSVNSTNPSTLFGGTWEQLKDRFLLGCGDTYSNGATGGEATHTLTEDEMPRHKHSGFYQSDGLPYVRGTSGSDYGLVIGEGWANRYATDTDYVNFAGDSQPHNNMPPYLAVYMWKRTA